MATQTMKPRSNSAWIFLLLLTLQYGAQPLLSKRFAGKQVTVTSSVLACECAKVFCAILLMIQDGSLSKLMKDWTLLGSLTISGLPAAIYALQNSMLQLSYRNLDSLTFTMLNQTKLFFTAFFMYLILRQKQSPQQIAALLLLVFAALLLSIGERTAHVARPVEHEHAFLLGVIPVLVASLLSGLASSLCQWASQVKKRSSYLMTVEMSIVGCLCMLASTLKSPDGKAIKEKGFFAGWTFTTLIPVFTNAIGGILVGIVTTRSGGIRKGFVIVSALIVTAFLQFIFEGIPPSPYVLLALPLVVISIIIYQRYPYKPKEKKP